MQSSIADLIHSDSECGPVELQGDRCTAPIMYKLYGFFPKEEDESSEATSRSIYWPTPAIEHQPVSADSLSKIFVFDHFDRRPRSDEPDDRQLRLEIHKTTCAPTGFSRDVRRRNGERKKVKTRHQENPKEREAAIGHFGR